MIRKCLFPAAGYGTRFLPATKAMPKEMLPIVSKPLIQYGVEEAIGAGLTDIGFISGRGKRAIEDHTLRLLVAHLERATAGPQHNYKTELMQIFDIVAVPADVFGAVVVTTVHRDDWPLASPSVPKMRSTGSRLRG